MERQAYPSDVGDERIGKTNGIFAPAPHARAPLARIAPSIAQCQVFAKLAADKASGMFKSLQGSLLFSFTAYPTDG